MAKPKHRSHRSAPPNRSPAPAPATHIGVVELHLMKKARDAIVAHSAAFQDARAKLAEATAGEQFLLKQVREKYGLLDGDQIDGDGKITRKPLEQ